MDGVDVLTFAGGIGENSCDVVISICKNLKFLGAEINEEKAKETVGGKSGIISTNNFKITICILPTNEELLTPKTFLACWDVLLLAVTKKILFEMLAYKIRKKLLFVLSNCTC